jgi:hypothetical protein
MNLSMFFDSFEFRRAFFRRLGLVLVRHHWRSRPGMAWTGIRDVYVREYVRRFPRFRRK